MNSIVKFSKALLAAYSRALVHDITWSCHKMVLNMAARNSITMSLLRTWNEQRLSQNFERFYANVQLQIHTCIKNRQHSPTEVRNRDYVTRHLKMSWISTAVSSCIMASWLKPILSHGGSVSMEQQFCRRFSRIYTNIELNYVTLWYEENSALTSQLRKRKYGIKWRTKIKNLAVKY